MQKADLQPVILILKSGCPAFTVDPSSTKNSSIIPLPGDGTGMDVYCKQDLQNIKQENMTRKSLFRFLLYQFLFHKRYRPLQLHLQQLIDKKSPIIDKN